MEQKWRKRYLEKNVVIEMRRRHSDKLETIMEFDASSGNLVYFFLYLHMEVDEVASAPSYYKVEIIQAVVRRSLLNCIFMPT